MRRFFFTKIAIIHHRLKEDVLTFAQFFFPLSSRNDNCLTRSNTALLKERKKERNPIPNATNLGNSFLQGTKRKTQSLLLWKDTAIMGR